MEDNSTDYWDDIRESNRRFALKFGAVLNQFDDKYRLLKKSKLNVIKYRRKK